MLSLYQNNTALQVRFISCVMSNSRPATAGPQVRESGTVAKVATFAASIVAVSAMKILQHCQIESLAKNSKSSPVTGLEWPRGFQEVKVPRFHENGTEWW